MGISALYIKNWLDKNLLRVQKPGRYIGGEYNQIVKPWEQVPVHMALVFPDVYEIGMPNLGLTILYDIINQLDFALAERAFSPWVDMEALMRRDDLPLFSLESKTPLLAFDIIGFSFPYESLYTNALNILDLARIPLHANARKNNSPLIIAGGHAVSNPEPMAEFIDAFALGDGEEIIIDILNCWMRWKEKKGTQIDLLQNLAHIDGMYVPQFYQPKYSSSGIIMNIEKTSSVAAMPAVKRIVATLPPPPARPIVPSIDVVHNRIAVEIMRGCSRGCRFCHAGMINRPIRERSVNEVLSAIDTSLANTGYEEVALLSLSSSDYSHIRELVAAISNKYHGRNLTISLPSLRIESMSIELLEELKEYRSGGFTLAPEAASERIRNKINKPITSKEVIDLARVIFQRGWLTIKLYFMIGLPGETLEDVAEIGHLCKKILHEGRQLHGKKINLHISVGSFNPKPHTPFQWQPMDNADQISAKQSLLMDMLRGPGLRLSWPDFNATLFESWLSRGDRRLSRVIETAWKNGTKFDAWHEHFDISIWKDAFKKNDIDPAFYSHRERSIDEILPWDHISMGVSKKFLIKEYELSKQGIIQKDCSEICHSCGVLSLYGKLRGQNSAAHWKCPAHQVKEDNNDV